MNKPNQTEQPPASPTPSLVALVEDDSLTELRRAYHAAEAFNLSPEHLATKQKLQAPATLSSASAMGKSASAK